MYYFDTTMIDGPIYMHQVGNKLNGEPLILSSEELSISQDALRCIKRYFLSSFKISSAARRIPILPLS